MADIDLHILTLPSTRPDWLAAIEHDLSSQPCNVHIVDGIQGHIGAGRSRAFALGNAEFVAFADPDDRVLPGALDACLEALAAAPGAVLACTSEQLIDAGGNRICTPKRRPFDQRAHMASPLHLHHIIVARRAPAMAAAERVGHLARCFNWAWTLALSTMGDCIRLPYIGYQWRVHRDGYHRVPAEVTAEILRTAGVLSGSRNIV